MGSNHSALNQHPGIDGLTLFTAPPGPHEHQIHEHDAYSIIGLTSGSKHFDHQGTTVKVNAYELAIANPGELHGCGPIDGADWSHRTWYLSQTLMQEIGESLGIKGPINIASPVIRDRHIAEVLIHAHIECDDQHDILESQSLALAALAELVEKHAVEKFETCSSSRPKTNERIALYDEWLAKRVGKQVELAELAELAGVQRNQVIKDFKSAKGVTPGNYFRLMRLKYAKQAIRDGGSLASVSLDAGFSDQSHFNRQFKAAFGVTPNRFKKLAAQTPLDTPL